MNKRLITDLSSRICLNLFDALCLQEDADLHADGCITSCCLVCVSLRSKAQTARQRALDLACKPVTGSRIGRVS